MNKSEDDIWPQHISETFLIHFNLPEHEIPLSTFIKTANETQEVIQAFNKILFEGKPQLEIYVLPPEDGTFLNKLKLVFVGGILGLNWKFLESDIGKSLCKGLTNKEPEHYAKEIGKSLRTEFSREIKLSETDKNKIQARASAKILIETSKHFLQKDTISLTKIGLPPNNYPYIFEARNRFYQACDDTKNLQAIGFEKNPIFPVNRNRFSSMQVTIPKKQEDVVDEIYEEWTVTETILKVTSPNWDRSDNKRQWKGKDSSGHERFFWIEDEGFWSLVLTEKISLHYIDTIKVQWVFRGKFTDPKNARVLKVLAYNGKILSEPLEKNALDSILGKYSLKPEIEKPDMFRSKPYDPKSN